MLKSIAVVAGSYLLSIVLVLATDPLLSRLFPGDFVKGRIPSDTALIASTALFVVVITLGLVACLESTRLWTASTSTAVPSATWAATPSPIATTLPAQPVLAADPALLAGDLAADEQALRDPSSSEGALVAAAHRQQAAEGPHPDRRATER